MQMPDEPQLECSSRELLAVYCPGLEMSVSVNNIYQTSKLETNNARWVSGRATDLK